MNDVSLSALRDMLKRGVDDPVQAMRVIGEAHRVACVLAEAPYSASKMFLPGLYLPCTKIIQVAGIVTVASGAAPATFPFEIQTPGIVVGLVGSIKEANAANSPGIQAGTGFQLNLEQDRNFASNGSTPLAVASFASFGLASPAWMPVMIPCRGSGSWNLTIANETLLAQQQDVTAIFNLAILEGRQYLDACRP